MKALRRLKQVDAIAFAMPMIERLDRWVVTMRIQQSSYIATKQLEAAGTIATEQISRVLTSLRDGLRTSDAMHIAQIERERSRLSQDNSPLDDGSLTVAGLYDAGQTVADACAVSKPPKPALLLYLLIRAFKPKSVIELGTNVGISSSFIGMALKDNGNDGKLVTMDASPYRMRQAREVHGNLMLDNIEYIEGLFTDTLRSTLHQCSTINFAFIDGHHQLQPTLDYFNEIATFAAPGAMFVFDDIRWSDGMNRAWSILQQDERFSLVLDLSSVGLCILRGSADDRRVVTRRLKAW